MAEGATRQASNGLRATEQLAASLANRRASLTVPNKPMVATATTSLGINSRDLGRRHIGQPLGAEQRGNGHRASKSKPRTMTEGRATMDRRQAAGALQP